MDPRDKKEEDRPFAYPKPTESDEQLNNQPEYIDQEPGSFTKEISDTREAESVEPQTKQ